MVFAELNYEFYKTKNVTHTKFLYVPVTVHREQSVKKEYQTRRNNIDDLLSIGDVDY